MCTANSIHSNIGLNKFRPDIELLRGLAVLAVLLFHLKIPYFEGGFSGVDVFFVLSGFLIAATLGVPDRKNIIAFFERRARRILPASLLVLILMALVGPFVFLPFELGALCKSITYALGLAPNVEAWQSDDYFSDLAFRPLLHYWSLGLEVQYYLLYPLLVRYVPRRGIWIILFVSFTLSVVVTQFSPKTAFFLLPTRIWEFLCGHFLFQLLASRANSRAIKPVFANGLALLALAILIGFSMSSIPSHQYPGAWALIPVLGASIFIIFGLQPQGPVGLIAMQPLRALGRISFSVYLFHFPVFFLFSYRPFFDWKVLGVQEGIAAVAVTVVLAGFSYYWIEAPFRKSTRCSTRTFWRMVAGCWFLLLSLLLGYYHLGFFKSNFSAYENRLFESLSDRDALRCEGVQANRFMGEEACYLTPFPAHGKKRFMLVGDSHMDGIKSVFVDAASSGSVDVMIFKRKCLLGFDQCTAEYLLKWLEHFQITDVVLHGNDTMNYNLPARQAFADEATQLGMRVHVIETTPIFTDPVPRALYKALGYSERNFIPPTVADETSPLFRDIQAFKFSNESNPRMHIYNPKEFLCKPDCMAEGEQGVYYFDAHHLTLTGARLLRPMVERMYDAH